MLKAIKYIVPTAAAALSIGLASSGSAAGGASPEEIVEKVQAAADMVASQGAAGLETLNEDGEWVWKDTYVFALNCSEKVVAAHPVQPELIGRSLTEIKDSKGNEFLVYLCMASKAPEGGWVEYWWPVPGMGANQAARKISYIRQVEGTPYQVSAGVYDEALSLWALNEGAN